MRIKGIILLWLIIIYSSCYEACIEDMEINSMETKALSFDVNPADSWTKDMLRKILNKGDMPDRVYDKILSEACDFFASTVGNAILEDLIELGVGVTVNVDKFSIGLAEFDVSTNEINFINEEAITKETVAEEILHFAQYCLAYRTSMLSAKRSIEFEVKVLRDVITVLYNGKSTDSANLSGISSQDSKEYQKGYRSLLLMLVNYGWNELWFELFNELMIEWKGDLNQGYFINFTPALISKYCTYKIINS